MSQTAREYDELPDQLENIPSQDVKKEFLNMFWNILNIVKPIKMEPGQIVEAANDARYSDPRYQVTAILHLDHKKLPEAANDDVDKKAA